MYWISTLLLAAAFLYGGYSEITKDPLGVELFTHLGYPIYFLSILGVAKILGAIGILQTKWPVLREWAYAGIVFDLVAAVASHIAVGDGPQIYISPIIALVVTLVSYTALKKRHAMKMAM